MTQAEITVEEFKAEMEKCKALFVQIGELLDGHNVGVGTITLAKSIATIAVTGRMSKEDYMELLENAYNDCVSAQQEEGLSSLH
jgi:hypothetical protein